MASPTEREHLVWRLRRATFDADNARATWTEALAALQRSDITPYRRERLERLALDAKAKAEQAAVEIREMSSKLEGLEEVKDGELPDAAATTRPLRPLLLQ